MEDVFGREELNRPIDSERSNNLFSSEQKHKEQKDELKNRISMTLKDPILQQEFEIICKNLYELEKENAELKDKLEILVLVGNTATKGLNYQLTEAKELLRKFLGAKSLEETFVAESEAKKFLKEVSE